MICKLLVAMATIAAVAVTACSDTTAPKNDTLVTPSAAEPIVEVTFTKWITDYPRMSGFTSYGAGTFAGEILSLKPFENGVIVQLRARYEVTDPSGSRSFKAVIQGEQNNRTGTAVLNGVITEGWQVGSHVHVTFQVIPCELGTCFQGTIRILRG